MATYTLTPAEFEQPDNTGAHRIYMPAKVSCALTAATGAEAVPLIPALKASWFDTLAALIFLDGLTGVAFVLREGSDFFRFFFLSAF